MNHPAVTVGIPAYNHEQFIDETLEAVAAQTYPNLELVIIDDGSSDGTFAKIEAFLERYPDRFSWVHAATRPNRGVCATLNEVFSVSRTEWVSVCGSDDILYPHCIETQIKATQEWENQKISLICGNVDWIDEAGNATSPLHGRPREFGVIYNAYVDLFLANDIYHPSVALRRDAVLQAGGFDEALYFEDWDMWLRLSLNNAIGRLDATLGAYRRHSSNMSSGTRKMLEGTLMTLGKFLETNGRSIPSTVKRRAIRKNVHRIRRLHPPAGLARLYWDTVLFRYRDPKPADFYRYAAITRSMIET